MAEQKGRTKMGEEKAGGAARGKAQHTPGPWEIDRHLDQVRIYSSDDACIADLTPDFDNLEDAEEVEANAKLIAAAPALADALEAVYSDMLDRYDSDPDPPSLVRQVRAALRAAGRMASTASAPKEPPEPTPDPEARR